MGATVPLGTQISCTQGEVGITTTSSTPGGQAFVGDTGPGDLWYFPAVIPLSLQVKNMTADGAEFVLIFDSGGVFRKKILSD
ncbi:hypothetical protein PM082_007738 [Marasmius tenuissimus]|nr:hypothetical protein PM082_007738 [Marasmius tenuissimus]